jgi:competence protein ComFB
MISPYSEQGCRRGSIGGNDMNQGGTQSGEETVVLVNIIEEFVRLKVKEAMKQTPMCHCNVCEMNVCAIALNTLSPRYVTTQKGHLFAQIALMQPDYQMDANIQIAKALKIVRDCPRH